MYIIIRSGLALSNRDGYHSWVNIRPYSSDSTWECLIAFRILGFNHQYEAESYVEKLFQGCAKDFTHIIEAEKFLNSCLIESVLDS